MKSDAAGLARGALAKDPVNDPVHVWRLRSHLSALLVVTMLLTFALVGGVMVAYRIPEIERQTLRTLQDEVHETSERMDLLLKTRLARLDLLDKLLDDAPSVQFDTILDKGMHDMLAFFAVYRVSPQGRVLAIGLPDELRSKRLDFLGSDLSSNALFQAVSRGPTYAWSGTYASALTHTRSVAVAVRGRRGDVLIAEVPFSSLLKTVDVAAGRRSWSMWVVERSGEIIAGTSRGREAGGLGVQDWPSIYAQLQWGGAAPILNHGGQDYHAAISLAPELGWYFVGEAPMAWANPEIRRLVLYMLASLAGCLLMGLLIASFWASLLVRPLRRIVARAAQATSGAADARPWPRGAVVEFNRLSSDLEAMEVSLQEREQTFQALFEASPVPIAVVSADDRLVMRDVNEAWCRALGRARDSVVGRSVSELGLMRSRQEQLDLLAEMADGRTSTEIWLVRGDGEEMLMQAFGGRNVTPKTEQVAIWVVVDIGPMRRIERELQELNAELEVRVEHRTQALAASNEELSLAVAQLRATQHQLVQAEKMASLGGLVAGVAHELNTPLGNGVMSVSAMADATRHFTSAMQGGLRRADFQQFIESVEQGVGIAGRNLRRAADLVQSFKQVAVDQTGAQRRSFELREVVNEMVASMRPSFSRTPYRIEVDVAEAGLRLDSYPGALGQTIGNLIQNAVLHGFDGRDHGTVRIDGERAPDGWIVLRVADDGEGIAAEHLGRLFDPFMTVKMGGGGTGLGLHISYNAVTGLLGGTLTVRSTVGEGTVFELRLPTRAPVHVDAPQQVGSGAVVPPAA